MATVYLARDRKHDRLVAIKVLRPELAAALGAERFLREIQIAAKLSHPHILQLYDSDEVGGQLLYVMPYVEGESLRQRLEREGRLPVATAVQLAAEVAAALDYAHQHGIVHRDIKPENILLHTGQAIVADFGIARAVDAASGAAKENTTGLTATGVIIGTPLYMSPEQVLGGEVDGRTDVYALGCVLYEMLTGEPPFTGNSAQAVLARHTVDPAPLVRKLRAEVPPALERIVVKALAKTPEDRFTSAAEFRDALTGAAPAPSDARAWRLSWRVPTTVLVTLALAAGLWAVFHRRAAAAVRSVAVLPFENRSESRDDEYFAFGITDELINALGRVPGLKVSGRTSAFALQRLGLDSRTIGARLNATMLLEGSALRAGTGLLVTAELVDAASDSIVWSDSYHREVKDIIDVEDEISHAIVAALQVHLAGATRTLVPRGTRSTEAHDLYLKGRYFLNQRSAGLAPLQRAIDFFRQALALDSNYAQAWAGLAQAYGFLAGFGNTAPGDAFALAKTAALRAVALDSALNLPHTSLGFIAIFHDWDWESARRELDQALALDSTEPSTYLYRAWYFRGRGQLDAALGEMRTARLLDPLNQIFNARTGSLLNHMHRYAEAEAELRQAIALDSTNIEARGDLAMALTLQHRDREALALLKDDTADVRPYPQAAYLGYIYGRAGRRADALAIRQRLERHARQRYITPETFAYIAMGLGDTTAALDWLERGYRERSFFLWTIGGDPVFAALHGSARFERMVRGIGVVETIAGRP